MDMMFLVSWVDSRLTVDKLNWSDRTDWEEGDFVEVFTPEALKRLWNPEFYICEFLHPYTAEKSVDAVLIDMLG